MKRKIYILSLCCLLLQSCCVTDFVLGIAMSTPPTYSCLWNENCHVQFNSVQLKLPGSDCTTQFYNGTMMSHYPYTSCYDLVNQLSYYPNDSIQINWITSVADKTCRSGDSPSQSVTYNQNNFFFYWQSGDYITEAPLISSVGDIDFSDLKHELIIQIFGVPNSDGTQGLITWDYTWVGNAAPSNFDTSNNTWSFEYPTDGLIATYTPTGNSGVRQIYIHDQFEFR